MSAPTCPSGGPAALGGQSVLFNSPGARVSGGNWKEMFDAAVTGDIELVKYHVGSGVDINYAHPEFLSTPLVASILAKQEGVAFYLLESGANPILPSEFDGLIPIQAARQVGLAKLEAKLVELGVPPLPPVPAKGRWLAKLLSRGAA